MKFSPPVREAQPSVPPLSKVALEPVVFGGGIGAGGATSVMLIESM